MDGALATVIVAFVGGAAAFAQALRFGRAEIPLLVACYLFHVGAAIAQVVLTMNLYGGGDLFGYALWGRQIAAALDVHFETAFPEVVRLMFQQPAVLPVDIAHPDSSTGSMVAFAGIVAFLTQGDVYTMCVACGVASYFGTVALYTAFRDNLPEEMHRRTLIATMLVPSLVFWSSALLKESIAMTGLGWTVFALHRAMQRRYAAAIPPAIVGVLLVALLKPYILFALVLAAGAWVYWRASTARGEFQLRPGGLLVGAAVGLGGLLLLGQMFPQYAIDNVAEEAAFLQEVGQEVRGGSTYDFGNPEGRTLAAQLVFAPLALISSLFRPFLFEARAPQIFVNALETTFLTLLFLRIALRHSVSHVWAHLKSSPVLVFLGVFTLVFGTAVGLGTTNLGTLSRYRMPLVPFFATLLAILDSPLRRARSTRDAPHRSAFAAGSASAVALFLCPLLAVVGCGPRSAETDAAVHDAGPIDGGRLDGSARDAGDGGADAGVEARDDGGAPDAGDPTGCTLRGFPTLATMPIVTGHAFSMPVDVVQPPASTDLYVVEKQGRIWIVRDGIVLPSPFLDLSTQLTFVTNLGDEYGLLGLAFHPEYAANGRFFVYWTPRDPFVGLRNALWEFRRSAGDPDRADADEVRRIFDFRDRASNHNGGQIAFGPDGYLYVAIGDEGAANDAYDNGLNLDSLFGKILRLDVEASGPDFGAPGNPFAGGGGRGEIWAYGFRNPWRFSFDRLTGDLWIGDVGQNRFEEIDFQPASSIGGECYGWRAYEANEIFDAASMTRCPEHTPPVLAFMQDSPDEVLRTPCSITGGFVYRGDEIPGLRGAYIFGDYCSQDVVATRYCAGTFVDPPTRLSGLSPSRLASFGEDNAGELYMVLTSAGAVVRIVEAP